MKKLKHLLALIIGMTAMFGIWLIVVNAHVVFTRPSLMGLIPALLSGFLGGGLTAIVAPNHNVKTAFMAATIVTSPMLYFLLHDGLSHSVRNPFFWYWPIYVPFAAIVGALLAVNRWRKKDHA